MELSLFPEENSKYKDTKFWSAKQKEKAYKCFARVLKHRDINKMDQNLYRFLNLYCCFIAHYNIHGFKEEYSGYDFRRFIEHFDRRSPNFCWLMATGNNDCRDVVMDMVNLATNMAPQIYVELEAGKKASELALCRAIAAKHDYKVMP